MQTSVYYGVHISMHAMPREAWLSKSKISENEKNNKSKN